VAEDDGDDCSSYDTMYSGGEEMEAEATTVGVDMGEPLKSLQTSIAAINAVQTRILEKLATMEKQVLTVQFDMTWVRDDMKGVHNVMENIAEGLCELKDATAEVDRIGEQVQAEQCAQRARAGKGHREHGKESAMVTAEHGMNDGGDACEAAHDPTGYEPRSYIEETQDFDTNLDTNLDMHINVVSSPEEDRDNGWGHVREASVGLGSPPCTQKRGHNATDVVFQESQQVEMTCPGTELPVPASC
jgi:hypothetical protein